MIEITIFSILSINLAWFLRKWAIAKSEKWLYIIKYILMFIIGTQYYSIFLYGGPTKGGYTASILFFEDFFVDMLQLPGYVQFVALAFVLYLAFFCHPRLEK